MFIHAGFGGIALVTGAISLIARKGSVIHKKSGKVFYFTMLTSALLALVISLMPNHESPFLFAIGIFSSYFLIGGYRSVKFKSNNSNLLKDKVIAGLIILTGFLMITYPIVLTGNADIVLVVFGVIDLLLFRNSNKARKNWMKIHLSKMISGYVAAVTAFVVVNHWIPGVWAWFTPPILGNIYLTYWLVKLNSKRKTIPGNG